MTTSFRINSWRALGSLLGLALPVVAPASGATWVDGYATSQQQAESLFTLREEMIPMRDGVRLYTRILTPKTSTAPLPFMFIRTPYGIGNSGSASTARGYGFLARDGYIFVYQDIRGKFKSEGEFVMQRPPRLDRNDPKAVDESTDAYDTIDWLLKNVPNNNGRVGMTGVSYPGWLTAMAMLDPHPALKAASPQASPADMWMGDDFHHQGAFRLSYGFEYATMMESGKDVEQFQFDTYDTYQWYLQLGSLANVNKKILQGKIPTWNDFSQHPNYDAFWQRQAMKQYLTRVTVPTLNVAGWWDQEDFYGPVRIYAELEPHDRDNLNFLVVGPWNHGGWMRGEGKSLGNIQFEQPTGQFFRDSLMAPFFAYYLRDKGPFHIAEATVFQAGDNRWRTFDSWPPQTGMRHRNLYFRENGSLSWDPPVSPTRRPADPPAQQFDAIVSDPAHPVPYRQRPIQPTYDARGSGWSVWLTEDQRFVDGRPDVLTYRTDVLEQDLTIGGDITVPLRATTSGSDADWIVKLIDVYPESGMPEAKMNGYQLMVANDVLRGRYYQGFEKPAPIVPNKVTTFSVDLHTQSYTFRKGHRVMVQVQSTWFPIIDRNPQTFVPNIFEAKESDFRKAEHRVYRSPANASHIVLPVVEPMLP
ncbi:MAG: CocE/NonD family hydrolase [Gemmatimonadetes bacterium]|nr:CocE/NonD family hydrolase [Gemmatimonadota bacterium]